MVYANGFRTNFIVERDGNGGFSLSMRIYRRVGVGSTETLSFVSNGTPA